MRIRCLAFILLFTLAFSPAHAALNLELTQGVANQLPIAVVPFSGANDLDEDNDVSAIVKNDLSHSGQFNASTSQTNFLPHTAKEVSAAYWRNKKVEDVVVGQIQTLGPEKYRIQYALVNVAQGHSQVLLQEAFTANKAELRRLSHHISDGVYEKLMGLKGVFSTRIAYILVTDKHTRQRRYSLQVADMDGYNAKPLLVSTQPIMSPAWSRDGKRLAYVSFEKVLPRIYIQQVNSGERELISRYAGINGAPAWLYSSNR